MSYKEEPKNLCVCKRKKMGKLKNEEKQPSFSHSSHGHPLEQAKLTQAGTVTCFGCKKDIVSGREYYSCKTCTYFLDHDCYGMPLSITHHTHHHSLKLEFYPPYDGKVFRCDICNNPGSNHWLYRCDGCQFDVHLHCATANQIAQPQPLYPSTPPSNNTNTMTPMGAPQFTPNASYVHQASNHSNYVVQPNGNNYNQASSYGYYRAPFVQPNGAMMGGVPQANQGMVYANGPGGFSQGGMGNGMAGVAVAGVATGLAGGIGQEAFQGAMGGWGTDHGSGSSYPSSE
ncbi:hypothetical protein HHK36_012021 [Tetracentron sinense]|uniref:DC1 domain-containing protein n=1 Tax=Tetracentron sinense TaxID=13715 RepID=A0A834ZE28_TETSI|nr:hypothetical protein HHK36_012021 [Tetracentron sinense]